MVLTFIHVLSAEEVFIIKSVTHRDFNEMIKVIYLFILVKVRNFLSIKLCADWIPQEKPLQEGESRTPQAGCPPKEETSFGL